MKRLFILFLIACVLVNAVQAGAIADSLVGKSTGEAATMKARAIAQDARVIAISNETKVPLVSDGGGKEISELTIKSITYDEKMNAVKVVYTATINGQEKQITNPVYIRNPPVMTVTGTKEVDAKTPDGFDTKATEYTTVEDPKTALLQSLIQVAENAPAGAATFIPGDPTLVVYANAADGYIYNYGSDRNNTMWNLTRGVVANSTNSAFTSSTGVIRLSPHPYYPWSGGGYDGGDSWGFIARSFEPFDTSGIGTTSAISSGKVRLFSSTGDYCVNTLYGGAAAPNLSFSLTKAFPLNPANITNQTGAGDFSRVDHIRVSTNVTNTSFCRSSDINFTLTNTSFINRAGWTTVAVRASYDIDGVFNDAIPLTGGTYARTHMEYKTADYSGTTYDPYMEIIYVANASPPDAAFSCTPLAGDAPLFVTCTDASIAIPTSWNWSFGDGGYSSLQNPTYTYTGLGLFSVNLTASNAWGSDFEFKPNYINVTTHPVINITSKVHFVFNGTNSTPVDNWSWKFSDDNNVSTYYGQDQEHWLEWGLTHIATLTAAEGVNTTVFAEVINLAGGSSGSSGGGGNTTAGSTGQDDSTAYAVGFMAFMGILVAIGLAVSKKQKRRDRE